MGNLVFFFLTRIINILQSLGLLRDKVAELTLQHRNKSAEVDQLMIELGTANNTIRELEDDMDRMEAELQEEIARLIEVSHTYFIYTFA